MVEIYGKQIAQLEDLVDISDVLAKDSNFQKGLKKYVENPYDADIERVAKGVFTVAVSKSESPSLDKYDETIAVTKANNEAVIRLACVGARYLTIKNSEDRRINALGLVKSKRNVTSMAFDCKGDTIYLVGDMDPDENFNAGHLNTLVKAIENELVTSAHYISSNGLFLSLLECCTPNELGFDITGDAEIDDKEFLFGPSRYMAVVTVNDSQENDFVDYLFNNNVPVTLLGHVTKGEMRLDELSFGDVSDYVL
ncbi:MAG: hypothetical protein IKY70_05780 [Bacteroidales bacterium]|nr:hypothetical protein [Bacteroidales bacterium]